MKTQANTIDQQSEVIRGGSPTRLGSAPSSTPTLRHSNTPFMSKLFIHARILQQIGHDRLARFLDAFDADLQAMNLSAPPPLPATHFYFTEVADFLVNTENLPPRLLDAMSAVETAAAPENSDHLNALIVTHIPDCTESHSLARALDLWLAGHLSSSLVTSKRSEAGLAAPKLPSEGGLATPKLPNEGGLPAPESDEAALAAPKLPSEGGSSIDAAKSPSDAASTVQGSTAESAKSRSVGGIQGSAVQSSQPSTAPAAEILNQKSEIRNVAELSTAPSTSANGTIHGSPPIETRKSKIENLSLPPGWIMEVPPSLEPVDASVLLDSLRAILTRFVILPKCAAETLALWIVHTYAFEFRDVTTYIGLESPIRRCGKSTLVTILSRLVNRPVISSNVSSPAMFHAIEELRPTLMIDEADTFLKPGDETQGILNAGYHRPTAYVLRVSSESPSRRNKSSSSSPGKSSSLAAPKSHEGGLAAPKSHEGGLAAPKSAGDGSRITEPLITDNRLLNTEPPTSSLAFFSCWCPKVISRIGRLPETLADRCIVVRMQRKVASEKCERIRNLDPMPLRRQCARFALDHAQAIADATPQIPDALNDRAADIWEPLLAIADLAGGDWPQLARDAALGLSGSQETSPVGSLLLDLWVLFMETKSDRLFTRDIIYGLTRKFSGRPWSELHNGKQPTEMWLAYRLRPFGILPRTLRIDSDIAKGYHLDDFRETFRRYISKAEFELLKSTEFPPHENQTNR